MRDEIKQDALDGTSEGECSSGGRGPWVSRNLKPGQFVKWGEPYMKTQKNGKSVYVYIAVPYDVLFRINKKKAYSGSVPIYNHTTKRFLAGFWQLLEVLE